MRVTARPGDVIVLPAGTEGAHSDTCRSFSEQHLKSIAAVPLPAADPVHGAGGPLFTYWVPRTGR